MTAVLADKKKWATTVTVDESYASRFVRPSLFRRGIAFIIDGGVISILQLAPASILYSIGLQLESWGSGAAMIHRLLSFSINVTLWAAYVCYFFHRRGGTPGKLVMRLRVFNIYYGTYPGILQTLGRESIGKMLSIITLGAGIFLAVLDRRTARTLHDRMTGTIVLQERE